MPVTSREINTRDTYIVTADQLGRAEPQLRRLIAALLWLFSLGGNVLAFGGGASNVLAFDRAALVVVGMSLGWQALCTAIQLICCKRWWSPLYLIALVASVVPSLIGYRSIIIDPLVRWTTGLTHVAGADIADLPASAIIWLAIIYGSITIALIAVDVIPERVFVKH